MYKNKKKVIKRSSFKIFFSMKTLSSTQFMELASIPFSLSYSKYPHEDFEKFVGICSFGFNSFSDKGVSVLLILLILPPLQTDLIAGLLSWLGVALNPIFKCLQSIKSKMNELNESRKVFI